MNRFYEFLLNELSVGTLVPAEARYVFVLESPHVSEVLHRLPAVGSSGKAMSKVLFGDDDPRAKKPLGVLLHNHLAGRQEDQCVGQYGLMNAVGLPMQTSAIPYRYSYLAEFGPFSRGLHRIKDEPTGRYKDERIVELRDRLVDDLAARIAGLPVDGAELIPCGGLSEALLSYAESRYELPLAVRKPPFPHPSRGGWTAKMDWIRQQLGLVPTEG
jgi:hypothetical protein